jgi:beta-glucosidase
MPAFPTNFLWGAATASYQIEGAASEDGRSESIWDRFAATPGKVRNGESGAVACDFYHRYKDDIALMRGLGLQAFRFSIAWPRILPEGTGAVNEAGLDFYDRVVDELLENDIEPFVTLYHWDLPQVLEERGGWPDRMIIDAFSDYVDVVTRRLGDRVHNWITHNEPWVAAWLGYGWGGHAPGRTGEATALAVCHNLMLSHGHAVPIIRGNSPDAQVGITLNLTPAYPASGSENDVLAVRQGDGFGNRWFLDPIFRGEYPVDVLERFGERMPAIEPRDLGIISTPIDFLGINNYSRIVLKTDDVTGTPTPTRVDGSQYTDMDWEVYPDGLHDLLIRVARDYAPKRIYVTENGAAFSDVRTHEGAVNDPERIDFLQAYLGACSRAIDEGVPLHGYFVWSLLDNFEWAHGYSKRFGIVYVEYNTLERVPKGSAFWYSDLIKKQTLSRRRSA